MVSIYISFYKVIVIIKTLCRYQNYDSTDDDTFLESKSISLDN